MSFLSKFWKSAPAPDHHPVRVEAMVVEDQEDEMEFLCGLLRLQSVLVTRARNIAGALELIATHTRFQLAFVDLNLANGSGIEVIRRIKESKRMTHVVVVSSDLEKLPLILSYGYIGILWKPYTVNSIREILYKHRLHRLPFSD